MGFMPAMFKCERLSALPILRVTGMIPPMMPEIDKVLLSVAIKIIEKAEGYEGKTMGLVEQENMEGIPENFVAVRFSIIFKSEDDLEKALSSIKEGLG